MASGSFKGGIYGDHYRLRVDWSSESNIAGNYSTCYFDYTLEQDEWYDLYIGARTNSLKADSSNYSWSSVAVGNGGNTTTNLGSSEVKIYHNEDGKKTAKIEVRFNIGAWLNGVYYDVISAESNIVLDQIHRTSSAQFENVFTIGDTVDITISRENDFFKHKLLAVIGQSETEIANNVETSYSWETGTWSDGLFWTQSASGQENVYGSLRVQTFYNDSYVGYKDFSFTARVPSEYEGEPVSPSVECVLSPDNKNFPESARDVYIKSRSKIKADFSGSFYNSSIGLGEYTILVGGIKLFSSSDPIFSSNEFIDVSGDSVEVVCSVVDHSGRRAETTKTISVLNYTVPVVEINSCDRAIYNEDTGTFEKNKLGERIQIVASLVPGTGYTSEKITLKYEISSGGTVIASGTMNSGVACVPEISFDKSEPFAVKVWATDVFGDGNSVSAVVPVAKPVFHAPTGGNGFALGMFSKNDGSFRCAYQMKGVLLKEIRTVNFLGADLKAVFTRFGNVTSLTMHGSFLESPAVPVSGSISIEIPEGFEADEDQITGENTVFPLVGRGGYETTDIGSVMITAQNQIKVYYRLADLYTYKDWTIGASVFWFNGDVNTEE